MVDIYADFIHMTVAKTKQVGLEKASDRLEQNKPLIKQYLKQNEWTADHITDHEWVKNHYGKMTDNKLRNTRGVCIISDGKVTIGHFTENGFVDKTKPRTTCTAFEFAVEE